MALIILTSIVVAIATCVTILINQNRFKNENTIKDITNNVREYQPNMYYGLSEEEVDYICRRRVRAFKKIQAVFRGIENEAIPFHLQISDVNRTISINSNGNCTDITLSGTIDDNLDEFNDKYISISKINDSEYSYNAMTTTVSNFCLNDIDFDEIKDRFNLDPRYDIYGYIILRYDNIYNELCNEMRKYRSDTAAILYSRNKNYRRLIKSLDDFDALNNMYCS